MIIVNIMQGTLEWFDEKVGKLSASNASKLITNSGEPSKQRTAYLYELAAEIVTGIKEEGYTNAAMAAGIEREDASRKLYEMMHEVEVTTVGVIYKDEKKRILCSPDGLVSNAWGLELKNPLPKTQVKYLLGGIIPSEYFAQIQFSLYVTGLDRWDFMSYSPGMKPLVAQMGRDKKFLVSLDRVVKESIGELDDIVRRIS